MLWPNCWDLKEIYEQFDRPHFVIVIWRYLQKLKTYKAISVLTLDRARNGEMETMRLTIGLQIKERNRMPINLTTYQVFMGSLRLCPKTLSRTRKTDENSARNEWRHWKSSGNWKLNISYFLAGFRTIVENAVIQLLYGRCPFFSDNNVGHLTSWTVLIKF